MQTLVVGVVLAPGVHRRAVGPEEDRIVVVIVHDRHVGEQFEVDRIGRPRSRRYADAGCSFAGHPTSRTLPCRSGTAGVNRTAYGPEAIT
ncbi:MAG TPA: hypothetical protein VF506_19030 [Streptosporangiaceae bacterium]